MTILKYVITSKLLEITTLIVSLALVSMIIEIMAKLTIALIEIIEGAKLN
jgi:hypothetical protein